MSQDNRITINEYKNYFIRSKYNDINIYTNIKTIDNVKSYKDCAENELKKLETLSKEYKLYDSSYDEFRISMGKFALGINKLDKLKINSNSKNTFINTFINLHNRFEDLERKNIMKDAYVWK